MAIFHSPSSLNTRLFLLLTIIFMGGSPVFSTLLAQESALETKRQYLFSNVNDQFSQNHINLYNFIDDDKYYSKLLYPDWRAAKIELENNQWAIIDSANINYFDDEIICVDNNRVYKLYPHRVKGIIINGEEFRPFIVEGSASYDLEYYKVCNHGDLRLLTEYQGDWVTRNDHPMGISAASEEVLVKKEYLYYHIKGEKYIKELPRGKKDFYALFAGHQYQVMNFAKEEGLSFRETIDAARLFNYYHSLTLEN